jgi:DNA-directed RNA polymerase
LDKLNKILRKEFVNLHSQPLLETLLKNFKLSYPELKFPEIPNRGELELNDVLKSTYFFS